jgi:hypothetical protein
LGQATSIYPCLSCREFKAIAGALFAAAISL